MRKKVNKENEKSGKDNKDETLMTNIKFLFGNFVVLVVAIILFSTNFNALKLSPTVTCVFIVFGALAGIALISYLIYLFYKTSRL